MVMEALSSCSLTESIYPLLKFKSRKVINLISGQKLFTNGLYKNF